MGGVLLGDALADALARVGVTPDVVAGWMGAPCGCKERQEKLNALDNWARRVARGKMANARDYLVRLTSQ